MAASIEQKTIYSDKWSFSGRSNVNGTIFWYLNLSEDEFFNTYLFSLILKATGKEFKLLRVYANGQTFGQNGGIHSDSEYNDEYTFLYYVNSFWHPQWGGNTVFLDDDKTFIQPFKPNLGILFSAVTPHYGECPSRDCCDLRVTVAYKLKEIHAT